MTPCVSSEFEDIQHSQGDVGGCRWLDMEVHRVMERAPSTFMCTINETAPVCMTCDEVRPARGNKDSLGPATQTGHPLHAR